jgi:DNA repair protein RecO (recombination protein O)
MPSAIWPTGRVARDPPFPPTRPSPSKRRRGGRRPARPSPPGPRVRTEALVLRTIDFGESDLVVHLLTPSVGRLTAIAKGARRSVKRFSGSLDVLNRVRIEVAPRRRAGAMARLDQARLIHWHPGLRERPGRFVLGCYLAELVDRLAADGAEPREAAALYGFAVSAMAWVERSEPDARLRVLLELRALDAVGLRPELSQCVRCGREPEAFHVPEGGAVCGACAVRMDGLLRVQRGTLRTLEQALRLDLDRLDRLALGGVALAEARELVDRFQRFHLGVELRSAPMLAGFGLGGAPR